MAGMGRMNGKPVGANGVHAPARLRRAAVHASVGKYAQASVAEQGTWFVTVGIDGRLEGPEGDDTG